MKKHGTQQAAADGGPQVLYELGEAANEPQFKAGVKALLDSVSGEPGLPPAWCSCMHGCCAALLAVRFPVQSVLQASTPEQRRPVQQQASAAQSDCLAVCCSSKMPCLTIHAWQGNMTLSASYPPD